MNIDIDVSGLQEMKGNFQKRSERIAKAIDTIIKKSIRILERYGKFYSPVKTGRMRASISEGISYGEKFGKIGPTVEYAKYVHRRVPFMFAAVGTGKPEIKDVAEEEVKKAMK